MIKLWKYLKLHEKCLAFAYVALALVISGKTDANVFILLFWFGWIFALLLFTQSIIDYEYEEKEEQS